MQNYDWQDILRRALASGQLGPNQNLDGSGGQYSHGYADPLSGLLLSLENGRVLANAESDNKAAGDTKTWDITNPASVGDAWYSTPRSIGGMLGDLGKDLAPLALTALGANFLGPMMGMGAEGAIAGGAAAAPSAELAAFLEANMGAGAPVGAGGGWAGAAGGLPEVSFGPWSASPDFGAQFINAAGDAGALGGGYTGTSMAGATGGLTPAALEGTLGTAGYGAAGAAGGASLGIPAVLNGAGAALPFAGASGGLLSSLGSLGSLAKTALPLLGAVAGAQPQGGGTQTNQRTLDPRVDAIFGGLLGDAKSWYDANKSGQNDTMRLAQSNLQGLLGDPRLMEGLYTQGGRGIGMMQGGVAANPFTRAGFTGTNWGG